MADIPRIQNDDFPTANKEDIKFLFKKLQTLATKEKNAVTELAPFLQNLKQTKDPEDREMIMSQISRLKDALKSANKEVLEVINKINLVKPVPVIPQIEVKPMPVVKKTEEIVREIPVKRIEPNAHIKPKENFKFTALEKETIKRLRKKEEEEIKVGLQKPSEYVKYSSKYFSKIANSISNDEMFDALKKDLIGANLMFTPTSYISVILFTTFLSIFVAIFFFFILLFFNFQITMPMLVPVTESLVMRLAKVIWIIPIIPIATFIVMYFYPSMEKKSTETGINQEIPFATIHMSAISGSMIDPTKIFSILIATNEYPHLSKEFTKLLNEINVYGNNLDGALRNVASRTASKKLAELFNGLATTITSGGDLSGFFEKRSETLLFDYRIEREKYTKTAETFMDIYISVVIAAPMIFMLLLLMMKVSGFGVSLSTGMITLLMGVGVAFMNVLFLVFLHLKQPAQ